MASGMPKPVFRTLAKSLKVFQRVFSTVSTGLTGTVFATCIPNYLQSWDDMME